MADRCTPVSGLHAVRNIAERLTGDFAMMPVVQNVALANNTSHHHSMGPYILAEAEPISENDDVEATTEAMQHFLDRGAYHAMDSYYLFFLQKMSPMQVLDKLLEVAVAKNQADDHYLLYPTFTWRALEYFGWDYAKYLVRPAVRYVTRPPTAKAMPAIDELIEEYGLLSRVLRYKTDEGETEAVTALADTIAHCETFDESPAILAKTLADGLSLEGTVEGLSVGGSALFLRSQTGNPMDVHINTGINIRRYLLSQPEISMQTKLRALFSWNTGPEVKSAQYKLAPVLQPEPEKVEALPSRSQEQLIGDMETLIGKLPVGERLPAIPIATWRASDEVKHAAVLAQQYADNDYDPDALIEMLAKIACRDSFTEMHAYKHHQATYEEFQATRPSLTLEAPGVCGAGRRHLARPHAGSLRGRRRGHPLLEPVSTKCVQIDGARRFFGQARRAARCGASGKRRNAPENPPGATEGRCFRAVLSLHFFADAPASPREARLTRRKIIQVKRTQLVETGSKRRRQSTGRHCCLARNS